MAHPKTPTRPFDAATHLRTPEEAAAYLAAALEEGDPAAFRRALGDVARARSMASNAEASGLGRESLYKALSQTGNPSSTPFSGSLLPWGRRWPWCLPRRRQS